VPLQVSGCLGAWNTNSIQDSVSVEVMQTQGHMGAEHTGHRAGMQASLARLSYPYSIYSSYAQDESTFDMRAAVNMSYQRSDVYAGRPRTACHWPSVCAPPPPIAPEYNVSWANFILSSAAYNRTFDHTTVFVEEGSAAASYLIRGGGAESQEAHESQEVEEAQKGICAGTAQATDGYVLSDVQLGQCALPGGKYVCGYAMCQGAVGGKSAGAAGAGEVLERDLTLPKPMKPMKPSVTRSKDVQVLYRHPLMGKKKLSVTSASVTRAQSSSA
jgi:hypothetical protein